MPARKFPKAVKYSIRTLPLAGVVASSFLNLSRFGQQFMILIVLLWIQVFFILEVFLAGK